MANKVFNIAKTNLIIFKSVINVKNFALINRCSYKNSQYILKLCSKIKRYQENIELIKIEQKWLFNIFLKYSGYKWVENKSVKCLCENLAVIRKVKKKNGNEGKLFYSCLENECDYFKWFKENLFINLRNRFNCNDLADEFYMLKNLRDDDIYDYEKKISERKIEMWNLGFYNLSILRKKHYESEILPVSNILLNKIFSVDD